MKEIPPEIGRLKNLHELILNHNNLQEIPPEIGRLKNLQWLDLNNNRLKEIGRLMNLEYNFQTISKLIYYTNQNCKNKCVLKHLFEPVCDLL